METGVEFTQKNETTFNNPENRFKRLAQNTGGILLVVEDPNVRETIPYAINYHPSQSTPERTVRVYRGVRYIAAHVCPQIPSLLKTDHVDQELIDLNMELADNPSPDIYEKIRTKNDSLGNSNYFIDKAERYIREVMAENGGNYADAFLDMRKWENTASPFVSASGQLDSAISYAMFRSLGMVIAADIPESLVNYDFAKDFDKELSVKGIIEQKYIKSILMVVGQHNTQDKSFIRSVQKLIK